MNSLHRTISSSRTTSKAGVYVAKTDLDFASVDDLWSKVYGEELGWLGRSDEPLYSDRYDADSSYLVAAIEGAIVGTMRMVPDSVDRLLPIDQFVDMSDLRSGRRLVECQRFMVLQSHRNRRHEQLPFGAFGGLVKGCLHWCIANGFTHIVADVFTNTPTTPLQRLLDLGFEYTGKEFVDTELAEKDRSVGLVLPVGRLFSRAAKGSTAFYQYLMESEPNLDVYCE